ncbi:MAG: hypothetical protein EP330_29055 [Deltaproteobacteria bacterium]|nr:MAG: hypothetical protein EP330_29055 [Deltaproteobacteria bacterium]
MRLLVLTLALLGGCQNSCQQICSRMARFAEDCGHTVPQAQIQACIDAQAGAASADDRATCREFGSLSDIEAEWTCDDVAVYFARAVPDTGE